MVGKIVRCLTQYYDTRLHRNSIKSRPALVLRSPENDDYVVLPISTIPNRINVNPVYDIEIDPSKFPKINLTRLSYIRTHRMVSIPMQQIDTSVIIGDLKSDYEELFLEIAEKVEQFHNEVIASCRLCRLYYLLLGGIRPSHADIVVNSILKQISSLEHDTHLIHQHA